MNLYPHNQEAYESMCRLLDDTGKACVVHPTGTGKAFIGYKYVLDHPKERILWLSPSDYILAEQKDNLTDGDDLAENMSTMDCLESLSLGV